MQIKQKKDIFQPITITLETREEADEFRAMCDTAQTLVGNKLSNAFCEMLIREGVDYPEQNSI